MGDWEWGVGWCRQDVGRRELGCCDQAGEKLDIDHQIQISNFGLSEYLLKRGVLRQGRKELRAVMVSPTNCMVALEGLYFRHTALYAATTHAALSCHEPAKERRTSS